MTRCLKKNCVQINENEGGKFVSANLKNGNFGVQKHKLMDLLMNDFMNCGESV